MMYRVYYALQPNFLVGTAGTAAELRKTHRPVAVVAATGLEDLFTKMQAEYWSPQGEARELIKALGLNHTSMSVGDVAVDSDNRVHEVEFIGWRDIGVLED